MERNPAAYQNILDSLRCNCDPTKVDAVPRHAGMSIRNVCREVGDEKRSAEKWSVNAWAGAAARQSVESERARRAGRVTCIGRWAHQ